MCGALNTLPIHELQISDLETGLYIPPINQQVLLIRQDYRRGWLSSRVVRPAPREACPSQGYGSVSGLHRSASLAQEFGL